jgi:hypothetical protein
MTSAVTLSTSGVPISHGLEYTWLGLQRGSEAHRPEPDVHFGSVATSQCEPIGHKNPSQGSLHSHVGHPRWSCLNPYSQTAAQMFWSHCDVCSRLRPRLTKVSIPSQLTELAAPMVPLTLLPLLGSTHQQTRPLREHCLFEKLPPGPSHWGT